MTDDKLGEIIPAGAAISREEIKGLLLDNFTEPGVYIFRKGRVSVSTWADGKDNFKDTRVVFYEPEPTPPKPEPPEEQEND